ncbi:MAG: bifunctional UDP-N-acetylglucosamine diphosphorylase/glucosamine-1-phosphate N-acetyltransferase GlmU [Anaerolineae bacterium]|nr:bifunctional UDP-N-acetylglucosamine diphosphorylase/glucosamine-1-phosphate N-acetyltransferase GlmU [Anaerolineae bacterium]
MKITAIILAAGQGTRMKSRLPKVLHNLCGQPLLSYPLRAAMTVSDQTPVVVIGHGAEEVQKAVGSMARFAIQEQQLGTAHAVLAASEQVAGHTDLVLIINADLPLLTAQTVERLVEVQKRNEGPLTILTACSSEARGFGRIIRSEDGNVEAIVEEAQATPEQLALGELNVGVYCARDDWLWNALRRVEKSPKGEYYLTDIVQIAVADHLNVATVPVSELSETVGINNRVHLAEAEALMRRRINQRWMEEGVTMVDPQTVYIDTEVRIGRDTVIYPNTMLKGHTVIDEGCVLGPNSVIEDTQIGKGCHVIASFLESAIMEDGSEIGPYGHLRKGAHLGKGVHLGNFGEVKDSYLGPGTKMGHFSYIGNATIGENVNIGCGTITCNYDGVKKHPTVIEDDVFIGSDTMLVAPVRVGKGAHTGAGAVITHDVPPETTVVGVPARPLHKKSTSE